ncbi:translation elongation factor P [Ehrlichia chaffeensis str. Heartland]|uniref:Elongation factor P n=1 Tax=Ehrlichia chaffeensis (strain ATCC CRL-10679 / Arkansas) TaxID=205920 RepID=EFP_EHRCR|nr:elongation factor P [Ehrlichia chaffeensis]Q2GG58.1 RecName: Full=Elongation factor P; Short=EF-P [Ehrlichia chaffeensis str. Arkansas]ABD44488.1 translation elongation factor P [Ehrlichia chaffeensis str. Arkansas]AHX03834.1 translation elongation factor P [Ehrlichia chaffeensis str. Heartland]AHX05441.1 translation elongation factor P [Ehrlichia chaffeensis str. Jax]AHX06429.1 translation elongation factor P [Ehrlichia chaffeensis str. Liberty]AHX07272.1 translation elongation factor P [
MAERGSDIRPGHVLEHNNALYLVVKVMHTQPGKGGAYIQAEMKNLKTGAKQYERFRADGDIKRAIVDESDYQYIYGDGSMITIMHLKTYEQLTISKDILGDKSIYLQDNIIITLVFYNGEIISAKVPDYVTLQVVETEAVIKGQTVSSSAYKVAMLENNQRISVPTFIKPGDRIVVYTPDDSYYERAKG